MTRSLIATRTLLATIRPSSSSSSSSNNFIISSRIIKGKFAEIHSDSIINQGRSFVPTTAAVL